MSDLANKYAGLVMHPRVRYIERRGSMEDHWIIIFLKEDDAGRVHCFIRELGRSQFSFAIIHRRLWQGAWCDPRWLDKTYDPRSEPGT